MGDGFVLDELPKGQTLQEHDRQHHPKGFHKGDKCKFRDELDADELDSSKGASKEALEKIAKKVGDFIPNVKVSISDKPFDEEDEEIRKLISKDDNQNWKNILSKITNKLFDIGEKNIPIKMMAKMPVVSKKVAEKLYGKKNSQLPLYTDTNVLSKVRGMKYATGQTIHSVGDAALELFLQEIDNPIAVFKGPPDHPGSIVILTRLMDYRRDKTNEKVLDQKGEPILDNVVITMRIGGDTYNGRLPANVITSAYAKTPEDIQQYAKPDPAYQMRVHKDPTSRIMSSLLWYLNVADMKKYRKFATDGYGELKKRGCLFSENYKDHKLGQVEKDDAAQVVESVNQAVGGNLRPPQKTLMTFLDNDGKVVGTYNRKTHEVKLYPGADADTIAHELCGHATWQYAQLQAAKGDSRLLDKMEDVVDDDIANPVWDEVRTNYGDEEADVQREEVWAHIVGHKGSKAIQQIQKEDQGRKWYQKCWGVVKDAWKGLVKKAKLNRVNIAGIEHMTPEEFSDYMVQQMTKGNTLGTIEEQRRESDKVA